MFHNQTREPIYDSYRYVIPVGGSRARVGECTCEVPCKAYRCKGCNTSRPWCCGGAPDVRCNYCVTGVAPPRPRQRFTRLADPEESR